MCELNCSLTNSGIDNIHCNDNGTTENSIDDFVEFTLNPSGIDVGAAYLVSASAGGIVTPSYGFYGNPTIFQLQSGSANGFTYTITIKDVRDASCYLTNTVSANPCSNQSISKCTGPYGGNGGIGEGAMWSVIGDTGNPSDGPSYSSVVNGSTIIHNNSNQVGYGTVNYVYSVYDRFVRIGDYVVFLNAVDPGNTKIMKVDLHWKVLLNTLEESGRLRIIIIQTLWHRSTNHGSQCSQTCCFVDIAKSDGSLLQLAIFW